MVDLVAARFTSNGVMKSANVGQRISRALTDQPLNILEQVFWIELDFDDTWQQSEAVLAAPGTAYAADAGFLEVIRIRDVGPNNEDPVWSFDTVSPPIPREPALDSNTQKLIAWQIDKALPLREYPSTRLARRAGNDSRSGARLVSERIAPSAIIAATIRRA